MIPRANISEVFVDANDDWTIELGFHEYAIQEIDSIRIETTSGSSILSNFILIPGDGFPNFDSLSVIDNLHLQPHDQRYHKTFESGIEPSNF